MSSRAAFGSERATRHRHKPLWATVCVLTLAGALHLANLREGHDWGDDFAMYIREARSIALDRPLNATGYVYNPHYSVVIGPPVYPPAYPLLLAPLYARFGLDYRVFKIEIVVFFLLFMAVAARILFRRLPLGVAITTLALLSMSP